MLCNQALLEKSGKGVRQQVGEWKCVTELRQLLLEGSFSLLPQGHSRVLVKPLREGAKLFTPWPLSVSHLSRAVLSGKVHPTPEEILQRKVTGT